MYTVMVRYGVRAEITIIIDLTTVFYVHIDIFMYISIYLCTYRYFYVHIYIFKKFKYFIIMYLIKETCIVICINICVIQKATKENC